MKKICFIVVANLTVLTACVSSPSTETVSTSSLQRKCENIVGAFDGSSVDFQIDAATAVSNREDLPNFCQLQGVIQKKIKFELRAPLANWNGKFVVAGCGGFCGALVPDKIGHSNAINESLKLGYAAITTDGGHQAKSWETQWAIEDPQRLDLFAGAWMPAAVDVGRILLEELYSSKPKRTYFSGCSNGGRLGMVAAQRYPGFLMA